MKRFVLKIDGFDLIKLVNKMSHTRHNFDRYYDQIKTTYAAKDCSELKNRQTPQTHSLTPHTVPMVKSFLSFLYSQKKPRPFYLGG